jgi:hypothetical protein
MVLLLLCTAPAPHLHRIVSKRYTLNMCATLAVPAGILKFTIAFFTALKAGAQQSLPVLYEGNSDFQFRFDDRTTLNRY